MPIYEYQCECCGKVIEQFQLPHEAPIEKCPDCEGKIHKLISNCSFQLKGTGWYATDYAKKALTNGDKEEKKSLTKVADSTGEKDSGGGTEKATSSAPSTSTPAEKD